MTTTVTLVPSPDGSQILAVGFIHGRYPLLLFAIAPTAWGAFVGLFLQPRKKRAKAAKAT